MTRTIVGPFNRVEGDLEVALDIEGGVVSRAEVTTTLYRGFEQILVGKPAMDALAIAPRICGICSVSQSLAAAAALRSAMGIDPAPNGVLAAKIAHAVENMADHLTHFYLFFMPDFARQDYAGRPWFEQIRSRFKAVEGQAAGPALHARSQVMQVMGLLAGKWPHSMAFHPGGTTQSLDLGARVRLTGLLSGLRTFLETTVFGADLSALLSLTSRRQLEAFAEAEGADGDFARFVRIALDLGLDRAGGFAGPFLSFGAYDGLFPAGSSDGDFSPATVSEDLSHSWMTGNVELPGHGETRPDAHKPGGYSWAKAPRLDGRAAEVGALARQVVAQDPLLSGEVAGVGGSTVFSRILARMVELAKVLTAAERWVDEIRLKQPFCVPSRPVADGSGIGLVEAARGSLGHWLTIRDGRIERYQIIAPTTWNFSPRDVHGQPGPLEQALAGLDVGASGAKSPQVQHIVRSFDPCMVCTAH